MQSNIKKNRTTAKKQRKQGGKTETRHVTETLLGQTSANKCAELPTQWDLSSALKDTESIR